MKRKPLELVVLEGGGRGARHSLAGPHVVLGRLDPSESPAYGNLLFPEPTVSRLHATLDWDEAANRYLLTHRSATNATLINKLKVTKPRHIAPGDKIQMGKLLLELRVGIGQHAEVELETVDFSALTKRAANQVYRPETVMPQPPPVPTASPQAPLEAPIPAPIPPPTRRPLPAPVFHEPYAPIEITPIPDAPRVASLPLFEFPDAEEQVSVVREAPRKIQLSSLPRREEPKEEVTPESVAVEEALVEQIVEAVVETEPAGENPAAVDEKPLLTENLEAELGNPIPPESDDKSASEPSPGEEAEEKPKSKPFRREVRKVGRNEKCPCGSGRKYKKCCGK